MQRLAHRGSLCSCFDHDPKMYLQFHQLPDPRFPSANLCGSRNRRPCHGQFPHSSLTRQPSCTIAHRDFDLSGPIPRILAQVGALPIKARAPSRPSPWFWPCHEEKDSRSRIASAGAAAFDPDTREVALLFVRVLGIQTVPGLKYGHSTK